MNELLDLAVMFAYVTEDAVEKESPKKREVAFLLPMQVACKTWTTDHRIASYSKTQWC